MASANLTDRQSRWFASVREGLERDTGKSLAEWVEIARACPEPGHRARLKWFKETHGLLQNRASQVLAEAFGSSAAWEEPDALIKSLWVDPASRAIFEAVSAACAALPDVTLTARKGYTAWSRKVQFAALRPLPKGKAVLGLAVPPHVHTRLQPRGSQSWSERLASRMVMDGPGDLNSEAVNLMRTAWDTA